jgi:hypothetical protein
MGSFSRGRLKEALKKISAGLRPVRAIQAHAFLEVAVTGQEFERPLEEGFRIQGNEIGLV